MSTCIVGFSFHLGNHIGTDSGERPVSDRPGCNLTQRTTILSMPLHRCPCYPMLLDVFDRLGPFDMPVTSTVAATMAPFHLFAYSTLLGTELYQSFVITKLAYQALPRSAFMNLQKRVFPIYFRSQTLLLGLVALTLPPGGPTSSLSSKSTSITFAVAGGTALLNLLIYGPRSQKLMIKRIHQGVLLLRCSLCI